MAIPDLSSLKSSFNGDIVTSDHPDYQKAIARWAANSQRNAKLIAFPKDISAVSTIIKWAVSNNVPIAIKCGGHAVSGASSIEEGVVIDLSRHFGSVKVDASKKIAYVGGGALWETVDNTLIKHCLASVRLFLKSFLLVMEGSPGWWNCKPHWYTALRLYNRTLSHIAYRSRRAHPWWWMGMVIR